MKPEKIEEIVEQIEENYNEFRREDIRTSAEIRLWIREIVIKLLTNVEDVDS